MKIIDALKIHKGRYEIPDASRDDLPGFFKEMGFKVGVEIGVLKGEYTKVLLAGGLEVHGVDPYRAYQDYNDDLPLWQERQDALYNEALENLKAYPNFTMIRKTSMEVVKDFEDGSLDFVYIDGHHGFKYVAEDIWEWSKKVRKGGVIAGHDYLLPIVKRSKDDRSNLHVRYVVDAYTLALGIKNWYVIGSKHKVEGQKRDRWRSWFWIQ